VITARLDPEHPREETRAGMRVVRLDGPPWLGRWLIPWSAGLARALGDAAQRFDLAHLHGARSPLVLHAAAILRRRGVRWILQPHGTHPHHGRHRLAKSLVDAAGGWRVMRHAERLVAVSHAEAAQLPRPSQVLANGVSVEDPGPVRRHPASLLFVGSEHPQKRADRLPGLLRALPGARLVLVGPFADHSRRRFGPDRDRVEVRGVLDPRGVARACAEASVVVHIATDEAFGFVPFEAALLGTPAVVTGGHGCGEWFGLAGGCVVPPDDAEALIRAVRERLDAPARSAAETRRVSAFCREHLTWERAAEGVEAVYREALTGAS
jgi:glycosyltransferase involved in cell wall biosynthesis